ncbi:hypothetical protein OKC48_11230 [Methylorubrum extorquens]|uniref:hypothetical protein n=1 Tax=Methylorubrum extorquens TaxID=408 RepID=UPI002238D25C|nr:hypothetical protein [Methylorubrum extorquens]UYW29042.1 hypothetical protein OKC48_11230 [Methylorubrum extorquens]
MRGGPLLSPSPARRVAPARRAPIRERRQAARRDALPLRRPIEREQTMKIPLFGGAKDPIAIHEADAKRRAHRIGRLDAQLAAARSDVAARTSALDEAVAAALDSGDGAEKTASHRSALTAAQDFVRSISDSLDRERAGLAKVEARLSEAREAAAREQAAAEIEAQCTALEAAAARLDQPVAALAKVVKALHAEVDAAYAGKGAKPEIITAVYLAEAIAHRLPELFAFVNVSRTGFGAIAGSALLRGLIQPDGRVIPHSMVPDNQARSAADLARVILADKRALAASIRAGNTALPTPPQPMRPREPEFRADPTMWLVIVAQSIRYRDRQGDETVVVPGQTQLPKLVAEEAIRRGLAHRTNTPAANRAAERIALARRDAGPPVPDAARAIDLGINLADAVALDIAQQRAAWRASQGLKADAA